MPDYVGSLVQVLPQVPLDEDYPFACGPGVRGGYGLLASEQASSTCAGPCPAGTYQPDYAATGCKPCPLLSYCEEGTASPSSCPDGTYGHAIGLRSAAECEPCPEGGYCVSGGLFRCATGSFNPTPNAVDASACKSCSAHFNAEHLTTASKGASDPAQCICAIGYYNDAALDEARSCVSCDDATMLCARSGLTLATLPLRSGFWRHSNKTAAVYDCNTAGDSSACLGGEWMGTDAASCRDGHEGPRCEWCSDSDRYYDAASSACEECGDVASHALRQTAVLLAIAVALTFLRLALLRAPQLIAQISSRLAQLAIAAQQFGLQAKFKVRVP